MSTASSPPRAVSVRWYLRQGAVISRFIAALLLTGVALRFAVAGARHALAVSSANFSDKPASHAPNAPNAPSQLPSAREAKSARTLPKLPDVGPLALPTGHPLRVTLGVNYGSPRADVYVNGSRVGQTPFLGDTSCKSGQPIRIEVVPDTGPPLTYLRDCRGTSLEINGPPP